MTMSEELCYLYVRVIIDEFEAEYVLEYLDMGINKFAANESKVSLLMKGIRHQRR